MAHYDLHSLTLDDRICVHKTDSLMYDGMEFRFTKDWNLVTDNINGGLTYHGFIGRLPTIGRVRQRVIQRVPKTISKKTYPRAFAAFYSINFGDGNQFTMNEFPHLFWKQRRIDRLNRITNRLHVNTKVSFSNCHHILPGMRPGYLLYNTTGNNYTLIVTRYLEDGLKGVFSFTAPDDDAAMVKAVKNMMRPVKRMAA